MHAQRFYPGPHAGRSIKTTRHPVTGFWDIRNRSVDRQVARVIN